jgi:EAL domain-containing protein (putative c-di-GMP-specific phosphodiesterase class I)
MASLHPLASPQRPRGGRADGRRDASPVRRVCVLVQLHNYNTLRRSIGVSGARRTMTGLVERLTASLPHARVDRAGRDVIEVQFVSDRPDALADGLTICRGSCAAPMVIEDEEHNLDLVLGGAIGLVGGDAALLIEEAEAALAEAQSGISPLARRAAGQHDVDDAVADAVDVALDRGQMVLHYQPKVHVRRQAIECIEALVRWEHPDRGLVAPVDFIPALERAQRMERLTLWTIAQAIEDQRRLRVAGHDLRVFINISGHLLADARFARLVGERIAAAPDARLGFEVTETSVIRDPDRAIAHLQHFDRIGIGISIDDYGAGLSSLAYLKQLPARELKIDKLFITQLTSSNRDPLIVRSTIDLAHALDMEVVAEGVESHAALALLSVMGCDMVQGYLISRPIALDALLTFLAEDRFRDASHDMRASFTRLAAAWKRA